MAHLSLVSSLPLSRSLRPDANLWWSGMCDFLHRWRSNRARSKSSPSVVTANQIYLISLHGCESVTPATTYSSSSLRIWSVPSGAGSHLLRSTHHWVRLIRASRRPLALSNPSSPTMLAYLLLLWVICAYCAPLRAVFHEMILIDAVTAPTDSQCFF